LAEELQIAGSHEAGARATPHGRPLRLEDLDYDLPQDSIAQHPAPERDGSRLLVARRGGGVVGHHVFRELPGLLERDDLLVLNDTRVLPARLIGQRERTLGKWEGLFVRENPPGSWEMLCQTGGRPAAGEVIVIPSTSAEGPCRLLLEEKLADGMWRLKPLIPGATQELLSRFGCVPLPPYIRKGRAEDDDRERYQTVFADRAGAVAAPTAGLHFTPQLFEDLARRGVGHTFVTLHVGPGTFQPVQSDNPAEHRVQAEWGELPSAAATALANCKARGGRVVAVGTTSVRVLETAARHDATAGWSGFTNLTICPPFEFRTVDALVTNFHLPRSSLLMLVAAFTGLESMHAAYTEAVAKGYRFYSYGDAMLIA
jgi:S-adenosylmethionine:tRNA ribosyltransferase-isomerase